MDNQELPLRENDDILLTKIWETMTKTGRELSLENYSAIDQSELKGKTEAYHFQYYKEELFNKAQKNKLDGLLKWRGIKSGIRIIEQLPTASTTKPETAKIIFECFAEAKDISKPECLLEVLQLCDNKNFPLVAFENDQSGLKDTIEDLKKYIADNKNFGRNPDAEDNEDNEENVNVITLPEIRYRIDRVEGEEKWLDPYNFDELPLVGRKKEIELLDNFIKADGQFKIWAIAGPSGSGKTRLASQWAYESKALKDWDCRVLHKEDRMDLEKWVSWTPDKHTLIIIDYLFGFEKVVLELMKCRLEPADSKVRLLLLDHVLPKPLHSDKRWGFSGDGSSFNRNEKYFYDLEPLDLAKTSDQAEIIQSIIEHRAEIDKKSSQIKESLEYLSNIQGAYHPLFAALVGDAIRSGKDFSVWNRRELIDYYLSGEKRLPWEHEDLGLNGRWASHFIATATARRGIRYKDLFEATEDCLCAPEHFGGTEEICQKIVSDDSTVILKSFEPDILGESFFLKFFQFIKKSNKYKSEFQQIFQAGNGHVQTKDAISFIGFIKRLTRNLLNDDQSQKETQELWDVLFDFMRPLEFKHAEPIRWAVSAGIIDIVDTLQGKFSEEKLITLLNQTEPTVLYRVHNSSLLRDAIWYYMRYFELTNKLTKIKPEFSQETAALFDRYSQSHEDVETPLMLAGYHEFCEIINALIDHGADIEAVDHEGCTALIRAVYSGHVEVVKLLLDKGANIDAALEGHTALILACFKGHLKVVKLLLDAGANIEAADNEGCTALINASLNGHVKVVKLLLDKEANIYATDNEGCTALMWASRKGHINVARLLLVEGADVHDTDKLNLTALTWACLTGHVEMVRLLLDGGANIHAINNLGRTALFAASIKGHTDVVRLLLDEGADIHVADNEGCTTLIWASMKGHTEVVKLLLNEGAGINVTNNMGYTALICSCNGGYAELVKLLLDEGENIHIADNEGCTALIWASMKGHINVARLLLDEGADIHAADNQGRTTLHWASIKGHIEVARLLLDRDADIHATDNEGRTALIYASYNGQVDVAKLLLDEGANIDTVDSNGRTALIQASINESTEVVKLLLEQKVQYDVVDNNGQTALSVAKEGGYKEIVSLLVEYGAKN